MTKKRKGGHETSQVSNDQRMKAFCEQNQLQLKSMKEVHALCLQLQKLVQTELHLARSQ